VSQKPSEFEQFDSVMRKVLSVSHEELRRREAEWKRTHKRNKRAKSSPASRVSNGKD